MAGWISWVYFFVLLISALAFARAMIANWRTPLLYSVIWALLGWTVACVVIITSPGFQFVALTLFGCASVAVMGARNPNAAAWQFVVCGLAGVLLLPLIESSVRDRPVDLSEVRSAFVWGLSAFASLNYLFTRLAFPTILLAVGGTLTFYIPKLTAVDPVVSFGHFVGLLCLWSAPAVAWLGFRDRRRDKSPTDRLWFSFRDRYGAVWALRVMEQFNRSAANAGSETTMKWNGLKGIDDAAAYERLTALLKRFGLPADHMFGPA
jgi:hypothetical protein